MELETERLEIIVQHIGEAVLATTETIDRLADRVDSLANQVQQQGYQIFALSDAIQTLAETQTESLEQINQLTGVLNRLATALESKS